VGVEGDHLIFDYLSKVGDLAQTALPANERVQLVAQLRNNIDRERRGSDSTATVRRILGKLGSPDEVVSAAGGLPLQRAAEPAAPKPLPLDKGEPRTGKPRTGKPRAGEPEWWWTEPRRRAVPGEEIAGLPGWTGGVSIPFDPPEDEGAQTDEQAEDAAGQQDRQRERRRRLRLRKQRAAEPEPAQLEQPARRRHFGAGALLETLAAVLLIAGASLGSWWALLAGWVMVYYSRRLSPREAKFAALGLPGLVFGGTLVWLWGRLDGRWGSPIATGQLAAAIVDSVPVTARIAAGGSALFLLWRSRRLG
jgi:hypothetical protein